MKQKGQSLAQAILHHFDEVLILSQLVPSLPSPPHAALHPQPGPVGHLGRSSLAVTIPAGLVGASGAVLLGVESLPSSPFLEVLVLLFEPFELSFKLLEFFYELDAVVLFAFEVVQEIPFLFRLEFLYFEVGDSLLPELLILTFQPLDSWIVHFNLGLPLILDLLDQLLKLDDLALRCLIGSNRVSTFRQLLLQFLRLGLLDHEYLLKVQNLPRLYLLNTFDQLGILFFQIVALGGCQGLAVPVISYLFLDVWVLDLDFSYLLLVQHNRLLQLIDFIYKSDHLPEYLLLGLSQQRTPTPDVPQQRPPSACPRICSLQKILQPTADVGAPAAQTKPVPLPQAEGTLRTSIKLREREAASRDTIGGGDALGTNYLHQQLLSIIDNFKFMASINELKEVLKETLEERGVLSQIRARIRAQIFSTLNDSPPSRPDLSNENLIINELIREYLTFNGYQHTLAVFLPESGQPSSPPFQRNYITRQLKIVEDRKSQELPLLYGLTFGNKKPVERTQ